MSTEVRYERLRPRQIIERREAYPAAYLPIGTIEWHGMHNPVGLDTLKAHALAVRCAQAGGGLVFPPLWYGESRVEGLMEFNAEDRHKIQQQMRLPGENFEQESYRFSPHEQYENYQRLLIHAMNEMKSLGFKVLVLVAGHYPLLDHARSVCALYHQTRYRNRRSMAIPWAFTGYELVQDAFPTAGDHAGHWETSLLMALDPGLVDLSELPANESDPLIGVATHEPVQQSSAEFGEKAVRLIVERVVEQVTARVNEPEKYYPHGLKL